MANLVSFDKECRCVLYTTTASIAGSLLGFVITGITIMLAIPDTKKMKLLKTSPRYKDIYDVFFNTIYFLAITVLISVIGLLIDNSNQQKDVLVFAIFLSSIISIFRVWRCVWVLKNIVDIIVTPPKRCTESEELQ